ncbi:hypothetical protein COP2_003153 [Malus domestica]
MTISKRPNTSVALEHSYTSGAKDVLAMERIWETLMKINAFVKVRKASQMKVQSKLIDIEKCVKALEGVFFSFEESLIEATPV